MRKLGLLLAAAVLASPTTAHAGVPAAAWGHITLRSDGAFIGFITTGIYATSAFDCKLKNPPSGPPFVECIDLQTDPNIDWECTHFLLTAQAPAPGLTTPGGVRGRIDCESPDDLTTTYVAGTGVGYADNYAPPRVDLGLATIARCYALGLDETSDPFGSWEVDCWEPGVANPVR